MESDYVIKKELIVQYMNEDILDIRNIEIDTKQCYFNDIIEIEKDLNYDSDDSTNEYNFDELYYLKIHHIPRIIYQNGRWRNSNLKYKYENYVFENFEKIEDIIKITKTETRYLSNSVNFYI